MNPNPHTITAGLSFVHTPAAIHYSLCVFVFFPSFLICGNNVGHVFPLGGYCNCTRNGTGTGRETHCLPFSLQIVLEMFSQKNRSIKGLAKFSERAIDRTPGKPSYPRPHPIDSLSSGHLKRACITLNDHKAWKND